MSDDKSPTVMFDYPDVVSVRVDGETHQWSLQKEWAAQPLGQDLEFSGFEIKAVNTSDPNPEDDSELPVLPVYQRDSDGPLGVPSGLIYIRLTTNTTLESVVEPLLALGFEIQKESPIPTIAWLRSTDPALAVSLSRVDTLFDLSELVVIEPVFLMEKQTR